MLLDAVNWLNAAGIETKTFGDLFVLLLAKRVIQLGYGLETLCEAGYAGDAAPLARTMLNGAINLVYLAEADRDGRAAAYVKQEQLIRRKRIKRILAQCEADRVAGRRPMLSEDQVAQLHQDDVRVTADEEAKLAELARQGIVPVKRGNNPNTWTGFTERELYQAMNAESWYLSFYALFSDAAHVSANSLTGSLNEILQGVSFFGPQFEDPQFVVRASHQAVLQVLYQLERLYGLGKFAEAKAIDQQMLAAIGSYQQPEQAGD